MPTLRAKPTRRPAARRASRAIRRTLFWLLLLAALAAAALWAYTYIRRAALSENPLFAIAHIDITTDGSLSPEQILHSAGVATNMNLFTLRPDEIRRRVEANPAVARALVSRRLPDALRIDVAERTPVARLVTAGGAAPLAIDGTGHVMGPRSVRPDLPLILGLSDNALVPGAVSADPLLPDLVKILSLSADPALKKAFTIQALDIRDRSRIRLVLSTGEEVLLSLKGYEPKLRRLPVMLDVARDRSLSFHTYDLTVDRSFPAR